MPKRKKGKKRGAAMPREVRRASTKIKSYLRKLKTQKDREEKALQRTNREIRELKSLV